MSPSPDPTTLLTLLLAVPSSSLPALLQTPQISSILLSLLLASPSSSSSTRELLHSVLARLARHPSTLTLPLLLSYAYAFQSSNASLVSTTITHALEADPELRETLVENGPTMLVEALEAWSSGSGKGKGKGRAEGWEEKVTRLTHEAKLALSLPRAAPLVALIYGTRSDVLLALSSAYNSLNSQLPPSITFSSSTPFTEPMIKWLQLKLELLESTYALLDAAFFSTLTEAQDQKEKIEIAEEMREVLAPLFAERGVGWGGDRPLVDRGLLEDLERYYGVREKKLEKQLKWVSREGDEVLEWFERVKWSGRAGGVDGLEVLRSVVGADTAAVEDVEEPVDQHSLALTTILDILPDESPSFLRLALAHPKFNGDAEKVIAALLEGSPLPAELERARSGSEQVVRPEPEQQQQSVVRKKEVEKVPERRNIFDGEKLDIANLRRGKTASTAPLVDRSFLTDEMKASIILRAEAESSDEEEEGEGETEAFLEDLDERGVAVRDMGVEEDEEVDGDVDLNAKPAPQVNATAARDALANPFTPAVSTTLELTYIASPSVFDKDSATRKSAARRELRDKTGLADEQIEGWRTMLERNPRRDKILAKHEFKGNVIVEGPIPVG